MTVINEQVMDYLQQLIDQNIIPGASGAIINGSQTFSFRIGDRLAIPKREPFSRRRPLYDIASITKVVGTVPLILQLIAQKRLQLTDSVSKFLPEWRSAQVTVRHLLTHTSDIIGYIPNRNFLTATELTTGLLGLAAGDKLGREVRYQDVNFILLGWVAEQLTGQSVHEAITKRILTPLRLPNATFVPSGSPLDVIPTELDSRRGLIVGEVHDPKTAILGKHSGAAGLFASSADLTIVAKWLLGQISYPDVVPDELITACFVDQTPMHTNNRSFGWDLRQGTTGNYIVHTGFTGPLMVIDRVNQRALVLLTNRVNLFSTRQEYKQYREQLTQIFMQTKKTEPH
ncbi:serine hydrolase [Lentilactobacillus senioris]|uniref:serine hydrolase domain-containing protein n=1 Tax=Lentilactobacillus senioris TaxID=931534 RepID=UPI00228110AE|nr:serine hydrolase domain-containing protein [Lentilactobacillus senioris]MCY9807254.1 serine hydrolase [Lentilactobacillus senioris]